MSCPFCEIKENTEKKRIIYPYNGNERCECGAWLDIGQMSMTVNGYKGIYDGAISLIADVVTQIKEILEYYDVNLEEAEEVAVHLYATQIIERLFIPCEGGTSKHNFMRTLGITDNDLVFSLHDDEEEEAINEMLAEPEQVSLI